MSEVCLPYKGWINQKGIILFNFATQYKKGFNAPGMDIGWLIDYHIPLQLEKADLVKEMVQNPSVDDRFMTPQIEVGGLWGVAYGHPEEAKSRSGKSYGEKMFWDEFHRLDRQTCIDFGFKQSALVNSGVLNKRPLFEKYHEMKEYVER